MRECENDLVFMLVDNGKVLRIKKVAQPVLFVGLCCRDRHEVILYILNYWGRENRQKKEMGKHSEVMALADGEPY